MSRRARGAPGVLEESIGTSLISRFVLNCFMCELFYLPYFVAGSLAEQITVERHLNQLLNLDQAREDKLIQNYTIVWKNLTGKPFPISPVRIRLYSLKGTKMDTFIPRSILYEIKRIRREGLINFKNT